MYSRTVEIVVGAFMAAGIAALMILAFKVSGFSYYSSGTYFTVTAPFDNIGGLKPRAPVSIAGVVIGRVEDITLNASTYRAEVKLLINKSENKLPADTSASILTQGLLGANYISLTPGFDTQFLKNGSRLESTHSAMILENLIGQLLFSLKGDKK